MGVHNPLSQPRQEEANPSAHMNLLGTFALEYEEATVPITSQRMQMLLAYLALHRAEPPSRQHLAFLLWPDSSESQAFTNLRTLLHRLHAALPEHAHLIRADSQTIRWSPECKLSLDVAEFEEAIQHANAAMQKGDDASACASLERAINRYEGDFLPDCYDEWVLSERERLRQLLLTATEQLVIVLEKTRQYGAAIPHARRLMLLDPLNEVFCLTLMRLHIVNGDRASALRVYHTCASTLQAELGIRPGSMLTEAYERLVAVETLSPADTHMSSTLPLVGRDQIWKRMQATWQVAVSGQPRLLVLSGEAGIGKTRLAEDLLRWANRQGMMTAVAQCYPAEGDLAYMPVVALIRAEAMRPGLKQLAREWLSEIARLVPDILATRPDLQLPGPITERWQRQRLFEALARTVLSADRPILLLIDDLQWCDRDSLEWLHFLLRYSQRARLLVVGTVRIEEIDLNQPLSELLETLRREGRASEIIVEPLSRVETAELAGSVAGRALSQEEGDHLYAQTEGNALFILETMHGQAKESVENAGLEAGVFSPVQSSAHRLDLPPRIQAVIAWRLRRLSAVARELLEVAAVIGRSFTLNVLAQAAHLDENDLVSGLDELWQRRILREQGPDAYDFTHDKLRAAAYAELSLARQRSLHRRVAVALEEAYTTERDTVSSQIAMHYERAGLVEQAIVYYRRAAVSARHVYAHEVAIAHFQRALALLGDKLHPQRVELYDQIGEVYHFVGRYEDARTFWQQALDLTASSNRLTRADLHRKLGNAWRDHYHYDAALQAYNTAEDALSDLDAEDNEALWSCWGQIKLERLNVLYWLGQTTEMLLLIDDIQEAFQQHVSKFQQARLHNASAAAYIQQNRFGLSPQAMQHARAYLSMVEETGDNSTLPAAHFLVGFTALWAAEDLDTAEREIRISLSLTEHSGDISLLARCLTYLTVIARIHDQVEQVETHAEQSLAVAAAAQMPDYIGAAHGNLAWTAWRTGNFAAVHTHSQQALEAWQRLPSNYMFEWIARWPLLGLLLVEDNMAEAVVQARELLKEGQKRMPETIELALETALHAANTGEHAVSRNFLQQAADTARTRGYL